MKRLIITLIACFLGFQMHAQDVGGKTLVSQSRTTSSNIGNCDITITYHSPSVNGRKIFGGIVPYNFVVDNKEYPWRAGSNQRTTIEFSEDVEINGQSLPAGKYGFLALVDREEWVLIFSSGKSWGAFNYQTENDVLRIKVKPYDVTFQEWLSYDFMFPKSEEVMVQLRWETTAVAFSVKTDALKNIVQRLLSKEEKNAADYQELANRYLEMGQVEEAYEFNEKSAPLISEYEEQAYQEAYSFSYQILKGKILSRMGRENEGQKIIDAALAQANGFNVYYYALNLYTEEGKPEEALEILKKQISLNPDNFQNHFAMGEYYLKEENQALATEHFKKAYELTVAQESIWKNYAQYLYLQNTLAANE